jgi:hypothetical protein
MPEIDTALPALFDLELSGHIFLTKGRMPAEIQSL